MAKRFVFTAPEALKDAPVIANYRFVDGKHERNEFEGPLVGEILVSYYSCTLEVIEDTPAENSTAADAGSLAKSNTSAAAKDK
jgi:hypothetical protein